MINWFKLGFNRFSNPILARNKYNNCEITDGEWYLYVFLEIGSFIWICVRCGNFIIYFSFICLISGHYILFEMINFTIQVCHYLCYLLIIVHCSQLRQKKLIIQTIQIIVTYLTVVQKVIFLWCFYKKRSWFCL